MHVCVCVCVRIPEEKICSRSSLKETKSFSEAPVETLAEEVSDNIEAGGWDGQAVSSDHDPDASRDLIMLHRTSLISRMEWLC